MTTDWITERKFFGIAALIFAISAAVTVIWCGSMASMGGMAMPGGWTMSMAWMRMPGQTWSAAAATFVGMWVVMMVAMMLPSLLPMLWPYRRRGRVAAVVALGYFAFWTAIGIAAFPVGVALAAIEMQLPSLARGVPIAAGVVVLIAGAFQFTRWKAHSLMCCRETEDAAASPWRHGLHLGVQCARCCGNLMLVLLVIGVMDLGVMAAVTAAITIERLAPGGQRIARATGVVVVLIGVLLIARS
jgi:predicted metal-binding membrane protein